MQFKRNQLIKSMLAPKRALLIYGPRRIGKTTMVKHYLEQLPQGTQTLYAVGDDIRLQEMLGSQDRARILDYARPYDVIVIDEAHQINNIGIAAKIIVDEFPEKKIILTGSSSFELSQYVGEPLVGRHFQTLLLPIAQSELVGNSFEKRQYLENILRFGAYPEIIATDDIKQKELILRELASSYLFKDILMLDNIKSPELLLKITKALAFQIGSEVSVNKLAKDVGEQDPKTVKRYLDLLEKTFIIKRVFAFSKNPRNEIRKTVKYYFYDLGVRNAIIERFQDLSNRDGGEIGALWENFIIMELYKKEKFKNTYFDSMFFWRTTATEKEIDIVIERGDALEAYECKWSKKTSENIAAFKNAYPQVQAAVVNRENYLEFLE